MAGLDIRDLPDIKITVGQKKPQFNTFAVFSSGRPAEVFYRPDTAG
jgi:hypothetical protein